MTLIRLHKYLADHGTASRRKCEEIIRQGFVKVNGATVREMGIKIDPEHDRVEIDPKFRIEQQKLVYLALHKPIGYITSVTGPEKPKVMELLRGIRERVFPVGRLDKETSGLLLFTNDGRFAYHMTHPKFEKEKEYEVLLDRDIPHGALIKLRSGVTIMGEKTQPAEIAKIGAGTRKLRVILREGKNRQIRRMFRKVGHDVMTLKRIRIGGLWLRKLKPGEWRFLSHEELEQYFSYIPALTTIPN